MGDRYHSHSSADDGEFRNPKRETLELDRDRISELPDSLLLQILSLLPLPQAIRTGTLSKRWQHLWTFVPNLVFTPDSDFPPHVFTLLSSPFVELLGQVVNRTAQSPQSPPFVELFTHVITRTLMQSRASRIGKFSIHVSCGAAIAPDVDLWIRNVSWKNVEDLSLGFSYWNPGPNRFRYGLPQHLFTYPLLKILKLDNCVVAPTGLVTWSSLKSLSIRNVELSSDVIERILSGCPVLESLELREYFGFNRLKIDSLSLRKLDLSHSLSDMVEDDDSFLDISAPHLCSLTISSHFYARNIRLEDVSSLVVADLSFYLKGDDDDDSDSDDYEKNCSLIQELIVKLHNVEELRLVTWCIQALSILEVKGLPFPVLDCKCLTLDMHIVKWDVPGLAKLLEISPYLETLIITTETINPREFFGIYSEEKGFDEANYFQSRKRDLLLHLKNVEIIGYRKLRYEFEVVKFLLENAMVLAKMVIHSARQGYDCRSSCCEWEELHPEAENLLSLPRSSAHAVVMISESP